MNNSKRTKHNIKVIASIEISSDYDPNAADFNMKNFNPMKYLNTREWDGHDPLTGMELVPFKKKRSIETRVPFLKEKLEEMSSSERSSLVRDINNKFDTDFDPIDNTVNDLLYICITMLITKYFMAQFDAFLKRSKGFYPKVKGLK